MRRIIPLLPALLLLVSLTLPVFAQSPDAFQFTRDNFPTLDGSTSMVPLGQAIASILLGESREDAADLIAFNRTTQSFRNLRMGECDLVIAAEPSKQVFDEMKTEAFPYQLETIAKEALIFVVNEDNPVDSLTREQVRDIYSGKITNWREVGGTDQPIEAFQRNSAAGSQVMMEKLVMDGTPLMEAPATRVPQAMGELIDAVRSFDGSANAIGYTVFYYAKDMQMAKGLKILKIDGILPSADTIRSEEYPYLNGYYACISALSPQDSPQRRLFDWLVSEEGQTLLSLEGYVRVTALGEAPASAAIRTDYTHYAPTGSTPALYTDFDCPKDHLEASSAYGLIYPYSGARIYASYDDPTFDYPAGNLYGFYNDKGQRITDPIYISAESHSLDRWTGDNYFWILSQDNRNYSFASKDGSFVSEPCYRIIYAMGDQILCLRDIKAGIFDLYDQNFQLLATQEDFRFGDQIFVPGEYANGLYHGTFHSTDGEIGNSALIDSAGNLLMQSENYIALNNYGYISSFDNTGKQTVYDANLNPILFGDSEAVRYAYQFNNHFFSVETLDHENLITDVNGAIFEHGFDNTHSYSGGIFSVSRGDTQTIYDSIGRTLYRDLPANWGYLEDGIFREKHPTGLTLHKFPGDLTLTIPGATYAYRCGDTLIVSDVKDSDCYYRLLDTDLHPLADTNEFVSVGINAQTNRSVLTAVSGNGYSGETQILSLDGKQELFRANGEVNAQGSHYTVLSDWAFSAYDQTGKLFFCYPYYGIASGD